MKGFIFFVLSIFIFAGAYAQTLTSAGNWDNSTNWDGGNIGDDISEDISFDDNIGTVTIRNGFSYTVGAVQQNNGNTLTVSSTGLLNVGSASDAKDYSVGNTGVINVFGTMTVWGKLSPGNGLTLNVTGTLVIKGDLDMGNDATLTVSGNVQIDGSLKGGNNTSIEIQSGGNIEVGQDIDVGNSSVLFGTGTMTFGGACTDSGSGFCAGAPLPIELLSFRGQTLENTIKLEWQTASEENNDYFTIERSTNGRNYQVIGTLPGAGTSFKQVDYSYVDADPVIGQAYYRLKQTDFDGNFEYFRPLKVSFFPTAMLPMAVYPNPIRAGQSFEIFAGIHTEGPVRLSIHDLRGKKVIEKTMKGGVSSLSSVGLDPGIYTIEVIAGTLQKTTRLSVQ